MLIIEKNISLPLDIIRRVFESLNPYEGGTLQLLGIKSSKKNGVGYSSREIIFYSESRMNIYFGEGKKSLNPCQEVRGYDGNREGCIEVHSFVFL